MKPAIPGTTSIFENSTATVFRPSVRPSQQYLEYKPRICARVLHHLRCCRVQDFSTPGARTFQTPETNAIQIPDAVTCFLLACLYANMLVKIEVHVQLHFRLSSIRLNKCSLSQDKNNPTPMRFFLLLWLLSLLMLVMEVTRVESLLLVLPTTTAVFTKTWCRSETFQTGRAAVSAAAVMHAANAARRISTHQSYHSRNTKLNAVSQKRQAILDGAEWASIKNQLRSSTAPVSVSSNVGIMTVVTGTLQNNGNDQQEQQQRVVAIQAGPFAKSDNSNNNDDSPPMVALAPDCWVYEHGLARIPKDISDELAMSTLVASLAPVHCAIPRASPCWGERFGFCTNQGGSSGGGGRQRVCDICCQVRILSEI